MKVRLYNIRWDKDADDDSVLPFEVTDTFDADFNPAEDAADYLSDRFGYAIFGCNFAEVL